jgi:poly-gamma-glutamate capsule biosynthesis protein CapA/YwtB (metallophosphatase superfamily)
MMRGSTQPPGPGGRAAEHEHRVTSSVGRVYVWTPNETCVSGGRLALDVVPLPRLRDSGSAEARLTGTFVEVRDAGAINLPGDAGEVRVVPLGNARPDAAGAFLFEPGRGGGRIDKEVMADGEMRSRYVQAARFGEVNAYYHLDRIAAYVDGLLGELGRSPLPRVACLVNAHHGATDVGGVRDGRLLRGRWRPFQGGHYRLPARRYDVAEHAPIAHDGEIHLGPGRKLLLHGALVELAGGPYRANASHNPGIIYHEYGHHLTRHTADFRANAFRRRERQDNRKTAMDEGTSDYWTAVMLGTPHIWACHRRHDAEETHLRSVSSRKTMAHYVTGPGSDPHANGTIWGAALWELRCRMAAMHPDGAHRTDLMVLQALVLIGGLGVAQDGSKSHARTIRPARKSFGIGLAALLRAGDVLFAGEHGALLHEVFTARGIVAEPAEWDAASHAGPVGASQVAFASNVTVDDDRLERLRQRVPVEDVPGSHDLLDAAALETLLRARGDAPLSFIAGGDVMLGGRAKSAIDEHGSDYPLLAVRPLLARAPIVMVNVEGPFAATAQRTDRQYSYRVRPDLARALVGAGVNVVTLANNHLVDCGRDGVVETLETLRGVGIAAVGAGMNERAAHEPAILPAGKLRVGLLAYYWNRRCAATSTLPGSAMDQPEVLEADIRALRDRVDRIVVTFHWGVPYERVPSEDDRAKARFAIDCGADAVIGHHPHVVQRFEVHRGRPIFYSVGNFAFGSGNSRAEGCLVGIRFEERMTTATVDPLYVKNRDPRVDYQPKLLRGLAARRMLVRLARESEEHGELLHVDDHCGRLTLPRLDAAGAPSRTGTHA